MNLTKVTLAETTDAELAIAASPINTKAVERVIYDAPFPLSDKNRQTLVKALEKQGFTGVMVDLENRITNPDALVDFNIAKAV